MYIVLQGGRAADGAREGKCSSLQLKMQQGLGTSASAAQGINKFAGKGASAGPRGAS